MTAGGGGVTAGGSWPAGAAVDLLSYPTPARGAPERHWTDVQGNFVHSESHVLINGTWLVLMLLCHDVVPD